MLEAIPSCAMPDASSAMRSVSGKLRICRDAGPAHRAARIPNTITVSFWKPCFGWRAPVLPGVICRRSSVRGTQYTGVAIAIAGVRMACSAAAGFEGLTADLEPEWDTVMVAGTFVKVHQHGTGAPKADARTTLDGRRAGLTLMCTGCVIW